MSLDQEFAEAWDASVAESVRFATYPGFADGVASFREPAAPHPTVAPRTWGRQAARRSVSAHGGIRRVSSRDMGDS